MRFLVALSTLSAIIFFEPAALAQSLPQVVARYRSLNYGELSEFAGLYDQTKECSTTFEGLKDEVAVIEYVQTLMAQEVVWFEGSEMVVVRFNSPEKQFRAHLSFWRDFSLSDGGVIKLYTSRYTDGKSEKIGFYKDRFIYSPNINGNSITYNYATRCDREAEMLEVAQKMYGALSGSSDVPQESPGRSQEKQKQAAPGASNPGHWFVIAGAWSDSQKINARMALLKRSGISAHVINTDDYANLTPGLKAVVLGPSSKDEAQTQLDMVQSVVPDAFIKQGN